MEGIERRYSSASTTAQRGWSIVLLALAPLLGGSMRGTRGHRDVVFDTTLRAMIGSRDHFEMTRRRCVFEYVHKRIGYIALASCVNADRARRSCADSVCGAIVGLLALVLPIATAPVVADVALRWQDDPSAVSPVLVDYLVDSNIVSDFVELVSANFAFEIPLVIAIGAASGPEYDARDNTIRLPHSYFEHAVRTQSSLLETDGAEGEETLAVRRALDIVEYTLYHLLGHALVGNDDVDFDATAEALSSWAMLGYWPAGAEQWQADITAFGRASQRLDGPLSDYWHEHALYGARERQLRCLIVGREPALLSAPGGATLAPMPAGGNEARSPWIDDCRREWRTLDAKARATLDTRLLEKAPLRRAIWRERADGGSKATGAGGSEATAGGARAPAGRGGN